MHRQQALSLLYTAQSDIPRYERQVRQTMADLATLIGTNDIDTAAYRTLDINAVNNYPTINIPVGLPSDLLSRRSDIASAYTLLVKAATQAKQARIARLPTLSLTAEAGLVSDEVKDFLKSKSISWSALLDFAQPLYRFGALKANEKSAIEQYNQALYNYRQSFVTALMEVESSLVEIATVRTQTERYKELIVSNRKIAELSIALYRNGLSSYLDVIDASRTLYDSQMQYSNLVASMYIAYIKLFKALGGEV
jgi:multidrug efflux system outer membrane protein